MAERARAALAHFDPILRSILESTRAGPLIEIWPRLPQGMNGCVSEGHVFIRSDLGSEFERTLCHELVHWHLDGPWNRLPLALDEGLAYLLDHFLFLEEGTISVFPGPKKEVLELAFSVQHCLELPEAGRTKYLESMAWAAGSIGLERLRQLCAQAESDGLATVPMESVWAELPSLTRSFWLGPGWLTGEGAILRLE